jgi:hypothetical protein
MGQLWRLVSTETGDFRAFHEFPGVQQASTRPRVWWSVGGKHGMGEVVIEVGELDHSCDPSAVSGRLGDPADVSDVGIIGRVGEQAQRSELSPRQAEGLELGTSRRGELEDLME